MPVVPGVDQCRCQDRPEHLTCAARSRPPSARSRRDDALKAEISRVHEKNYCVLGVRKMHAMRGRPEACERHGLGHVAPAAPRVRLMRDMGLRGHRPRQIAQDDPVRTEGRMPGGPGGHALQRFQTERLVGVWTLPPLRGRYPHLCAHPVRPGGAPAFARRRAARLG